MKRMLIRAATVNQDQNSECCRLESQTNELKDAKSTGNVEAGDNSLWVR